MKRCKRSIVTVIVLIGMIIFGMLGWKYLLPRFRRGNVIKYEEVDTTYYRTLTARAEAAKKIISKHGLSENYCLFLDYGINSGTPRLFVWDLKKGEIAARCYVMHGPGKGSTAETPVFSDEPGSKCSTLGIFVVTREHGYKLTRSFRLKGLDRGNRHSFSRGLMIHRAKWVDKHCDEKYIPLHEKSCSGCVTVSKSGMKYLEELINGERKRLLLWNFCENKQNI